MTKSIEPLRNALIDLVETQFTESPDTVNGESATLGLADDVLKGLLVMAVVDGTLIFFECSDCKKWGDSGLKSLTKKVEGMGKNGKR